MATHDAMLVNLVASVNSRLERINPDESVGVTLLVNGHIITGKIIPAWQMYEDMGKGSDAASDEPGPFGLQAGAMREEQRQVNELLARDRDSLTDEERSGR
jgi:hypothetical protein